MDSQDFNRNVELYLLGELDPAYHQEMRKYLEDHPGAREQVEASRKMLDALEHHLSGPPKLPDLSREVLQHIWIEEQKREIQARPPALMKVFQSKIARIAAALAVILAGLALIHQFSGDDSGTQPPDELAYRVRARLLEISDGERREDGSILCRTRWKVTRVLQGDPAGISLAFHPMASGEKTLNTEGEGHFLEKKEAKAREELAETIRKRGRGAGEPLHRGEKSSAPGEIDVLLLRPDGSTKFLDPEEVGEEKILILRRIGPELFALDPEPLAPGEAGPADFSGRWSGLAVDWPEDGSSRDSVYLEIGVPEGGLPEGVASGEFAGGSKSLRNLRIRGNRLLFDVEHRTGATMEIQLALIGYHLVGEGIPADPEGDRCDLFLSRMPSRGKQ